MTGKTETAAEALVHGLIVHGTTHAFCVPGESYLAVLDALYDVRDTIKLVTCRHESGAANMAEAAGKLTGQPGICFVTRGPGATHASIGVHTAFQNSTPMILFIGQAPTGHLGREAFQEVDYRQMFGGLAKSVTEVDKPGDMAAAVAEAFRVATSDRPGPVVVSLPEDVLRQTCDAVENLAGEVSVVVPTETDILAFRDLLAGAERPIAIIGGPGWSEAGRRDISKFLAANDIPAAVAFRSQDVIDNRHPCYVGDLGFTVNARLKERIKSADLVLAIGTRLGEITTSGYTTLETPRPHQKLAHIHCWDGELGKVYEADVSIHAGSDAFAGAAADMTVDAIKRGGWAKWRAEARGDYEEWLRPLANPGPVQLGEIFVWLNDNLAEDSILTNGAGNYTGWLHRHYQYKAMHTQLAPKSGAMGYGVPAAIAAKIIQPERDVICFAGDGCFMMTAQELATAVRYRANVVFLVFNNGMYGTIRMHQERDYPARVSGTDITNPDFAAFAESFGAHGVRVERTEDFAPAFEAAQRAGKPTVIEIMVDPQAIATHTTLDKVRAG